MRFVLAVVIMTVAGGMIWNLFGSGASVARTVDVATADIVAGERIYSEYCAACHGTNLEGQGDWRSPGPDGRLPAPPHDETGHTWHHGDQLLFDYTKLGGTALMAQRGVEFDSGMPGFEDQLTDAEIYDVLAFIKSTWSDRIQTVQAERTQAEKQQD